jgi:hypothetical protein
LKDGWTDRQAGRLTALFIVIYWKLNTNHIDALVKEHREKHRQVNRQTEGQKGKQTDRQTKDQKFTLQ